MTKSSHIRPSSRFKRRRICLPYLPTEIIFKILLCLPADILYDVMRYVCRGWYAIIKDPKFIGAHLQGSPTGLLIQFVDQDHFKCRKRRDSTSYLRTYLNLFSEGMKDRKGFEWFRPPSKFLSYSSYSNESLKFPGMVLASCNGLVLVSERNFLYRFYVANLSSREWVKLPPFNFYPKPVCWLSGGLGYANSCKAYKVAYPYFTSQPKPPEDICKCAILTLGVDKAWRSIKSSSHIPGIPDHLIFGLYFHGTTYSTGGYVHWVFAPRVLSLNVETESFHVSVVPNEYKRKTFNYFLAMESCLSFASVMEEYIFQLWSLVDAEKGHWKKLQKIDLSAQIDPWFGLPISKLLPVALLKNGELFILKLSDFQGYFMIYNVKTGAIDYFEADSCFAPHIGQCCPFDKSLVSPKLEMKLT